MKSRSALTFSCNQIAVFASILFLEGCRPSERELKLEGNLEQLEKNLESERNKFKEDLTQIQSESNKLKEDLTKIQFERNALKHQLEKLQSQITEQIEQQQAKLVVRGSVFVATKGGESIKMSLVPVSVVSREDYELHCKRVEEDLNSLFLAKGPILQKLLDRITEINLSIKNDLADYKDLNSKHHKIWEDLTTTQGLSWDYLKGETISYYGIAHKPIAESFASKLNEVSLKINTIYNKINPLIEERSRLIKEFTHVQKSCRDRLNHRTRDLIMRLGDTNGPKTRSDSDGKFTFELESGGDYVISGYGERTIAKDTETYNWIVPLTIPKKSKDLEVFLSNQELKESIHGDQSVVSRFETILGNDKEIVWIYILQKNLVKVKSLYD